ncbi:MAG TPA: pyridoxamine 5'-phosphate oxidase family protein [Sphingomicrobium sp.]|nr:pyridoxamine 5'-phosphate oxidase family protein [Sphingomicrobium sp.]
MQEKAIKILEAHRTMAISTLRPDGWPQTTIVGYANIGLTLYFLVFRASQKLANIRRDRRISIAVGGEPAELSQLTAVYAAAHASEVKDREERSRAWCLLQARHRNLMDFELPERTEAAMLKAECQFISVLDYREGLGHIDEISLSSEGMARADVRVDQWGSVAVRPGLLRPKAIRD